MRIIILVQVHRICQNLLSKQECIPVGCVVKSASVSDSGGGGGLPGGVYPGGVCLGGVCLGGVCLGGIYLGGVCLVVSA